MLSKEQVDTLLQNPRPLVRQVKMENFKIIEQYIKIHDITEGFHTIVSQLENFDVLITEETEQIISFTGSVKSNNTINKLLDSWYMTISK